MKCENHLLSHNSKSLDWEKHFLKSNPKWLNSIIGDKSYGKSKKKFKKIDPLLEQKINNFGRQALHAKSLGFIHPTTNKDTYY